MKRKLIGFYISMGVMILFAVVAIVGMIIFYAKAASQTVAISLSAAGVVGVIISFAVMACFIPRNKDLAKIEENREQTTKTPDVENKE